MRTLTESRRADTDTFADTPDTHANDKAITEKNLKIRFICNSSLWRRLLRLSACPRTVAEQCQQCFHVVLVGSDRSEIHTTFADSGGEFLLTFVPCLVKRLPHLGGGGVEPTVGAGLHVAHSHQTHAGQAGAALVVDLYGGKVMLTVGYRHAGEIVVVVDEIAQQKGCAPLLEGVGHEFQRHADVGATAFRLHVDYLAYDEEDMLLTLLGGMNFSIRSLKNITPTLSLFCMDENARVAAISAITSFSRRRQHRNHYFHSRR